MKKISDFNSATEKYPVIYAGSATRPEYVDMPTILQQQEGVAPMDTLPAQWWNAMWKLATRDINAFRDYVGDAFTEINNLLTKFGITLDDADSEQLYDFFHDDYVQNYLNGIFVNKSGDTIDGDLHVKGDLTVDGIGEEIISTELKVGANTITLRNGNPSALGNTELAGVVTENYDGNNHNNIISIDKNGVARTGDIDIATRILYSNNGTNFFTDEDLTIPATIGTDEKVRDTGNQTSGGVEIYEGITYSNNDTQAIATREDNPVDGALMKWDGTTKKLVSAGAIVDVVEDGNMHAVTSNAVADCLSYSTDEILTGGKWIDGKPIYRKVVVHDVSGYLTGIVTIDPGVSNIETPIRVVCGRAEVSDSSSGTTIPAQYDTTTFIQLGAFRPDGLQLYAGSTNWTSLTHITVCIEYTKTTD